MMLFAGLVLLQSLEVLMVAQQSIMKPLASLNRSRNRRAAYNESMIFDARQILQSLEFLSEAGSDFLRDVRAKLE